MNLPPMTLTLQTPMAHRQHAEIQAEIRALELARVMIGAPVDADDAYRTRKRFEKASMDVGVLANGEMYVMPKGLKEYLMDLRDELARAEGRERPYVCRACGVDGVGLAHFETAAHRENRVARTMAALPTIYGEPVQYCPSCEVSGVTAAHFTTPTHRARVRGTAA